MDPTRNPRSPPVLYLGLQVWCQHASVLIHDVKNPCQTMCSTTPCSVPPVHFVAQYTYSRLSQELLFSTMFPRNQPAQRHNDLDVRVGQNSNCKYKLKVQPEAGTTPGSRRYELQTQANNVLIPGCGASAVTVTNVQEWKQFFDTMARARTCAWRLVDGCTAHVCFSCHIHPSHCTSCGSFVISSACAWHVSPLNLLGDQLTY
jgi:hypothetical protein